jgi:2',3'-cyclic-nucleotide 2'-phosphodiesterase (5'-nucleotidase family)
MRLKFSFYIIIAVVLFVISCVSKSKTTLESRHYETSLSIIDSSIYQQILPFQKKIQDSMNQQIAEISEPLLKETPEGNLGNFVCDALFKKHADYLTDSSQKADFVLLNNGGLRTNLPSGSLSIGKIFELMPFENELVIVTLDSAAIKQMLDFIAKKGGMPVSNLKMTIDGSEAKEVFVSGKKINEKKNYKVLTSDYLVNGGDNMLFFSNAINKYYLKKLIRTSLIEYCLDQSKKGNKISSKKDGRIKISK